MSKVICPKAEGCQSKGLCDGHYEPHEQTGRCRLMCYLGIGACVPVKPDVIVGYPDPNPFTPMQDRR